MMQQLKEFFLKRYISKNITARERQMSALAQAKSIGIVCEITNEEEYIQLHKLFTSLQNNKRSSWLVGYINAKEVPHYCHNQLTADYYCNKNINWYGKPNFPQLLDFTKKSFDILIDFSSQKTPSIELILALSQAKFIIGTEEAHRPWYDLYLDVHSNDFQYILQQIDYYTKQLIGQ